MDCIGTAQKIIKDLRKTQKPQQESKNVVWKGIPMTVDEAWAVVRAFEQEKARLWKWHRNTQTGAGITQVVGKGLSKASQGAGKGLGLFMPMFGGLIDDVAESVENLGKQVGEGIQDINEKRHFPMFEELDRHITSLEQAIEKASSH
jgi:hypothetical protein